ncbi:Rieske (2Fe-2S) protein [Pararobbsia silviterrae]|uniref:Rieske (2Fe-2S) protein n=2 Tax=Pararobbsia silviterrae TaxID=1792498 RepID=A0A494Y5K4_9BURK|nr:Rieske (2Fe-2S) protein [Pararobbsia silviterrae]
MTHALCALDAIPDGGGRAVALDSKTSCVVLRRGDAVWAYENRCPHFSIPLDFEPGQFCTYDSALLMCAHHSAMFRFEDGHCIDGPCEGAALTRIDVECRGDTVYRVSDTDPV